MKSSYVIAITLCLIFGFALSFVNSQISDKPLIHFDSVGVPVDVEIVQEGNSNIDSFRNNGDAINVK